MKLISLYIENFGGLSRYALDFESGITTVMEPNGFGKTTLAEFIRAMFYGLPRQTKTLDKNRRQKFAPWNGGQYGGNLIFEHHGKRYRVERTFGVTPKTDTVVLIDLGTNRRIPCFTEELGQKLFGLDADSFERSTYLPQLQADGPLATVGIQAKLTALVEDSSEIANFDKAMALLRTKRSTLIPYRGNGGSVAETAAEITRLQLQLDGARLQKASLHAAQEEVALVEQTVKTTQARLTEICEELETASRQAADCQRQHEYRQLCERHRNIAEQNTSRRKKYPRGLPTEDELRRAEIAADRLQQNAEYGITQRNLQNATERLRECRSLCEAYEQIRINCSNVQHQLTEAVQEKQQCFTAAPRRWPSIGMAVLAAGGLVIGAALLSDGMMMYAFAAFGIAAVLAAGVLIACLQNRKVRTRQRMLKTKIADLQTRADALNRQLEGHGSKLTAVFAEFEIAAQPLQYHSALVQLEQRVAYTAQRERETHDADTLLHTFFVNLGLTFPQDIDAALQDLREDLRASQTTELYLKELEARIDTMENERGDILFAEYSATRDPSAIREEERQLRQKLMEATKCILHARQNVQLLRRQIAVIPELEETLKYNQQKLRQDRENAGILDATMAFLQQAKENLSTAYMGTIRARFGYYLSQLGEASGEDYLIDSDFRVQPERLGKARELAYFSAGQTDLVMLCMRLALVDALFKDEETLLILDDPFVNLDDAHTALAGKLLRKIASHRQILYLTCHSSRII